MLRNTDAPSSQEPTTCLSVSKLGPDEDRCSFVKAHCESDAVIDWMVLYYCHPWLQRRLPTLFLVVRRQRYCMGQQ
jgi:hypothetical protein